MKQTYHGSKKLFEFINTVVHNHSSINLLGICFGAQVIAQALQGRVEKMETPFIRGGETLITQPSFYELDYIKSIELDKDMPLVVGQAHGDHVVTLPPGAILHASSIRTNVEIYTIGSNVLAIQGHPEFSESWTAGTFFRRTNPEAEDYDRYAEEFIKERFPMKLTQGEIMKICNAFLKKETN